MALERIFHQIFLVKNPWQIVWIYHPVPMDFLTIQGMDCLEKLSEIEKRIFLESLLDIMPLDDSKLSECYMQKAMEVFEKPIPKLGEKEYLSNTRAFQNAFLFIKQDDKVKAVPSLEINGKLFLNEIPNLSFVTKKIQEIELRKSTK